jgi:hypothetical protein
VRELLNTMSVVWDGVPGTGTWMINPYQKQCCHLCIVTISIAGFWSTVII